MKLLRVIHTVQAHSGGPIEGLKQASRIMSELGVEVEIACLDTPETIHDEIEQFPWRIHALGPGKLGNYSYSSALKDWLDTYVDQYDAVIIHGNWQYHGLATSKACRRHSIPYFIYPHGMLDPWFNETYPLKKLKKRLYWNWGEHPILHHAKAVLFTCAEECNRAQRCFSPYSVNEKVIGYGTNASQESIDALTESSPHPTPYFLFLGRIQEKKGLDLLIEAYASMDIKLKDIPDLLIAGPEQQPDYAQRLKSNFPQANIHWIGSVEGAQKWRLLACAEALILPSHQENFGIVVAEALAVGTPTLISNKVNIYNEIEQHQAGLVENDDLDGTSMLIEKWCSLSPAEKNTMANAAENLFKTHFEIRKATESLITYIQETIDADERLTSR
ncbi:MULTISPECIES: glycosyltransferase [unclassified Lentimonas]|uniref:glycosyltransferase n=1 Tax=unclassified Lentimonas TaxID=2630993 RepID=UPI001329F61A|nr:MULTISPECIES: glycosyltransferase [unclassified Lentimonas]CAA6693507.1 Unannotated [Lentimonas sp. CC19]CAA6695841.1 Unannotated [Lentimonas sp. CC10]CAA7069761.1 Unannotated [Lentimonas sp. CC11]